MDPTIHQLECFDAVVNQGTFQAAAEKIRRAQPSVSAAVKNLEIQLGLKLLDRSFYRVSLTEAGRSFHERTRVFLHELAQLKHHAAQLAMGEEPELRVVVGDLCPLPQTLALLRRFFDDCPGTRLNLYFEALSGPWERPVHEPVDGARLPVKGADDQQSSGLPAVYCHAPLSQTTRQIVLPP